MRLASSKQAKTALAGERQQRNQSEEAAAQTLEAGRSRCVRRSKPLSSWSDISSISDSLQQQLGRLHQALAEEKLAHELTRGFLAEMIIATKTKTPSKIKRARSKQT